MRSFKFCQCGAPLQMIEEPTPQPVGTQVLLKVKAAGVCHSDIHIWDGYYELGGGKRLQLLERGIKLPLTMGHENVGEVVAVGPDAKGVKIGAVMLATILGGAGGNLAQSGLIFTGEKLKPDWSKVSPLKGFKRIFGPDGLVQFVKTFLKLLAVGVICWLVLKPHVRELETLAAMSPAMILPFTRDLAVALLVATLVFMGFTAGADYLWQRFRFAERMKMTKEETKEDYKQSEGDPHVKAKLKQIRAQRSRQRMMQNVPKATVIVTNPTHYSVALRYDTGDAAPVCVAKGVDALALRIREVAREHKVPIVENVPLARALYAAVDVDETIPREHFEAAAKVIGFVMQKRKGR